MTLFDRVNEDLKSSMKAKDHAALRAIRAIKSALLLAKTEEGGKEIKPEDEIKILQRLVKQRKESMEIFEKQNRQDLYLTEKEELDVIQKYLPAQMGIDEVKAIIKGIIDKTGARTAADIGKVMPVAMKELSGKADGKTISEVAKELLSGQ